MKYNRNQVEHENQKFEKKTFSYNKRCPTRNGLMVHVRQCVRQSKDISENLIAVKTLFLTENLKKLASFRIFLEKFV